MQYLEENSVNFFQPEHKILFAYKSRQRHQFGPKKLLCVSVPKVVRNGLLRWRPFISA